MEKGNATIAQQTAYIKRKRTADADLSASIRSILKRHKCRFPNGERGPGDVPIGKTSFLLDIGTLEADSNHYFAIIGVDGVFLPVKKTTGPDNGFCRKNNHKLYNPCVR